MNAKFFESKHISEQVGKEWIKRKDNIISNAKDFGQ